VSNFVGGSIVKRRFIFAAAVLALSGAAAHAQPSPAAPATPLPGVTVEAKPTVPAGGCRVADRACYAVVASQLKTQYPDVYWKLAQKCMQEELHEARDHANPLIDSDLIGINPETAGEHGDINGQNAGEKVFCSIAQADAKPPPKAKKP
jgi:hypothetical protein